MTHDAETVERVAKAISGPHDATHIGGERLKELQDYRWTKHMNNAERNTHRNEARAAIAAMPPKELSVQEALQLLLPDIERIVKATEPHFVSHEDVEDTIHGMKIRTIVAIRALSEGKA